MSESMQFSQEDVRRFAEWSADRNPLHVDAGFARQTHFGQPIVHGILTVLGSLASAGGAARREQVRRLELEFRNAVLVDGEYSLESADTPDGCTVTLQGGGNVALTIRAQTGAPTAPEQDLDLSWARAIAAGREEFTTEMREWPCAGAGARCRFRGAVTAGASMSMRTGIRRGRG